MERHAPVLVVVLPLVGALIASLVGFGFRRRAASPWVAWSIASITVLGTVWFASRLLEQVVLSSTASVRYALGNWKAPWGIEYVVDPLNASVALVVATIAVVSTLYCRGSVEAEIPRDRHPFFYALWLLAIAGLLGMTLTGDAFNVYVLLEISSLAMYALIALGHVRDRRALSATFNYIILGSIGASFILIGIGYLYMVTGHLNMGALADALPAAREAHGRTVEAAYAFLMVGFGIKMAIFPLHLWLPNAYTYAPSAVTSLIASTSTKVALYLAMRFFFDIFGVDYSLGVQPGTFILLVSGSIAIVLGALSAARQIDVKRLLAYSSVGQIGYIAIGFALANPTSLTGAVLHIVNHAVTKSALFMAVGCVALRVGSTRIDAFRGLAKTMPATAAAILVGFLGLIGVPLTAGFLSKWYLVSGAIEANSWPVAGIILLGSLLALYYSWRVVEAMYFCEPSPEVARASEAPLTMTVATWTLVLLSIVLGVSATEVASLGEAAALDLLTVGGAR